MSQPLAAEPRPTPKTLHRWQDRLSHYVGRGLIYLVLVALSALFLVPLFWMVSSSLKPQDQLYVFPPIWIPQPPQWHNFYRAVTFFPFLKYMYNTLYIITPVVIGTALSGSFVAYGFSRIDWTGRDKVFAAVLATMMLPYAVTMVPVYLFWRRVGMIGIKAPLRGFGPLIIPAFFGGGAFNIFLFRQFLMTIPHELSEAARIDGCSELRIYRQIILPLAKPVLATVSLFTFLGGWNDFLGPLIYLNSIDQYTLSLGLRDFQGQYSVTADLMMAASTVVTLPIIVLFFLAQRTFIQGIALTGIKG